MILSGKCAIITGGASGIGHDLVLNLASAGVNVVFGDINDKDGFQLQEKINNLDSKKATAVYVHCDVRELHQLEVLFSTANKKFGGAQIVINNAGIFPFEDIENKTDFIESLIDVHLKAAFFGTSLAIRHFRQQRSDDSDNTGDFSIINISSIAACASFPNRSIYSSCKAAILHFSQNLAYLQSQKIRVNCVLPSAIDTPMYHKAMEEDIVFKEAVDKMAEPISTQNVVNEIISFIENTSYAGEALIIEHEGTKFLPRL